MIMIITVHTNYLSSKHCRVKLQHLCVLYTDYVLQSILQQLYTHLKIGSQK